LLLDDRVVSIMKVELDFVLFNDGFILDTVEFPFRLSRRNGDKRQFSFAIIEDAVIFF